LSRREIICLLVNVFAYGYTVTNRKFTNNPGKSAVRILLRLVLWDGTSKFDLP
jgi:hypothetical protein